MQRNGRPNPNLWLGADKKDIGDLLFIIGKGPDKNVLDPDVEPEIVKFDAEKVKFWVREANKTISIHITMSQV